MRGVLNRPLYTTVVCRPVVAPRRFIVQQKQRVVVPPAKVSVEDASYYIGKSIILFTMFYCSMNWVYYRGMRKELEKESDTDADNKSTKKK